MNDIAKAHKNRFHGSGLGCPRQMALSKLGYKPKISKKLEQIFEEGREHDEVMKQQAEEEFGPDFHTPETKFFSIKGNDGTVAKLALTPDGLLPDELVEFKGLSSNNYNSIKTEADLREGSPLFQKYYLQVQTYAGAFRKDKIRFRVKNKRNLKTKDLIFDADPKVYSRVKKMILDVQRLLDKNELPPIDCSDAEKKFCRYSSICKTLDVAMYENQPEKELTKNELKDLSALAKRSREIKKLVDDLEVERREITDKLKGIMREHGQKQIDDGTYLVKYGVRYKNLKDLEVVKKLVEDGTIPTEEVPEEYLEVREHEH